MGTTVPVDGIASQAVVIPAQSTYPVAFEFHVEEGDTCIRLAFNKRRTPEGRMDQQDDMAVTITDPSTGEIISDGSGAREVVFYEDALYPKGTYAVEITNQDMESQSCLLLVGHGLSASVLFNM